ncbi:MAG: alpha/beta hydrolase [bacterium]
MRFILIIFLLAAQLNFSQTFIDENGIPRDTSFTVYSAYQKIRNEFPEATIAEPILPDGVVEGKNIAYSSIGNRELHLDIFYPESNKSKLLPIVILIHGGGWRSGDKSMNVPMAQRIALNEFVTATIEYRLSPEAKYPASVYDIKSAIRWIRANAIRYNIDTNKIAILGCSSGAQLATLVGMTNGLEKFEGEGINKIFGSNIQAIINIDGIVEFTSEEALKYEDDPKKNPSAAGQWFGGTYNEKLELWKEASPLFYVNQYSPPIIFINSSLLRFHCGRDEMIAKLNEYEIYSEVHTVPDTPHPFWLFHPWFDCTNNLIVNFLNKIWK